MKHLSSAPGQAGLNTQLSLQGHRKKDIAQLLNEGFDENPSTPGWEAAGERRWDAGCVSLKVTALLIVSLQAGGCDPVLVPVMWLTAVPTCWKS